MIDIVEFDEWYTNLAAKNRFLALLADQSGFTGYLVRVGSGDPSRNPRFWEHEKADAVEAFFGAVAADCGGRRDTTPAVLGRIFPFQSILRIVKGLQNSSEQSRESFQLS